MRYLATLAILAGALAPALFVGGPAGAAATPDAAGARADFVVLGAPSAQGVMRASLCAAGEVFPSGCKRKLVVPAQAARTEVVFTGLPPGRYAFAVLHDEDSSGRLGVSSVSGKFKGFGFSNDARGPGGLPAFDRAAVQVTGDTTAVVHLRFSMN